MRVLDLFSCAGGANFSTHITNQGMVIVIDFGRELTFDEAGAKLLEDNAHNSLEQNLARYY